MWSQDWGTMIWGTSAIPTLGPTALGLVFLAGVLLGGLAVGFRRAFPKSSLAALLLVGVTLPVLMARAIVLPHTFVNGTIADADEVNENFETLESAVDALEHPEGFVAIPESAFRSRNGGGVSLGLGNGGARLNPPATDVALVAPVIVPAGATISRIEFHFRDDEPNFNLRFCLYRNGNTGGYAVIDCVEPNVLNTSASVTLTTSAANNGSGFLELFVLSRDLTGATVIWPSSLLAVRGAYVFYSL